MELIRRRDLLDVLSVNAIRQKRFYECLLRSTGRGYLGEIERRP